MAKDSYGIDWVGKIDNIIKGYGILEYTIRTYPASMQICVSNSLGVKQTYYLDNKNLARAFQWCRDCEKNISGLELKMNEG